LRILLFFISLFIYTSINPSYAFRCTTNTTGVYLYLGKIPMRSGAEGTPIGNPISGPTYQIASCSDISGINAQIVYFAPMGVSGTGVSYNNRIVYPTGVPGVGYALGAYSACNMSGAWHSRWGNTILCQSNSGMISPQINLTPLIQFYNIRFADDPDPSLNHPALGRLIGIISHKINGQFISNSFPFSIEYQYYLK